MKLCNYLKNMSQKFRIKNINKTRNYFLEEIEENELMGKKPKNICTILKYTNTFLFSLLKLVDLF